MDNKEDKLPELTKHQEISDLWLEYQQAVERYILKIVKDRELTEHLSHEVLLKIYSSCCSGRPIRNFRSWMFQIAYNTCMDHFREQQKTTSLKFDVPEQEEEQVYEAAALFVAPLIRLLPEKYSTPLYLSDIQNLKQQEVAEKLSISLTAAKSRIQRGKKLLKELIMECVDVEVNTNGRPESFQVKKDCKPLQEESGCKPANLPHAPKSAEN